MVEFVFSYCFKQYYKYLKLNMNNKFKNMIDQYKNGQTKSCNESFSAETILDGFLELSSFTNVNFLDLNLTNVNFDSNFFDNCSFEKAERGRFSKAWFESCHFIETNFNWNLTFPTLFCLNFINLHWNYELI